MFFHPGSGIDLIPEGLEAKEVVAPTLSQTLLNIIPINPVEAMSKGELLPMIFFAIIFGFALAPWVKQGVLW